MDGENYSFFAAIPSIDDLPYCLDQLLLQKIVSIVWKRANHASKGLKQVFTSVDQTRSRYTNESSGYEPALPRQHQSFSIGDDLMSANFV
jgi:hypothetical protein